MRILVVEDHHDTRHMLALVLTHLGHRVKTVPDAGTALDRARQDTFDALLTDIYLPNRDGWDLLAELRVRGISPLMSFP